MDDGDVTTDLSTLNDNLLYTSEGIEYVLLASNAFVLIAGSSHVSLHINSVSAIPTANALHDSLHLNSVSLASSTADLSDLSALNDNVFWLANDKVYLLLAREASSPVVSVAAGTTRYTLHINSVSLINSVSSPQHAVLHLGAANVQTTTTAICPQATFLAFRR